MSKCIKYTAVVSVVLYQVCVSIYFEFEFNFELKTI